MSFDWKDNRRPTIVTLRSVLTHICWVFGRPFVKRFAVRYRTVVLSVLSRVSVCDVGVLCQTVGWIKMPLGMEVGLGLHIVLDGDPAPPKRGHSSPPPNFRRSVHIVAKRSPISATAELLYSMLSTSLSIP